MAKKQQNEEIRTSIDDINDKLTEMGQSVQKNQKAVVTFTCIIGIIVAAVILYIFMVRKPAIEKANNMIGEADRELIYNNNDSVALEIYKDAAEQGYAAGNRAKLMAAIQLYKNGNYEEALGYVKDYSAKDDVIGAAAYSLEGDCYVNLDQLDNAVSAFKKAIKQSDENPAYTPFFMLKLARVYRAQDNYADAIALYEEIQKKYPNYGGMNGVNVEKELAYVKNLAAGK